MKKLNVKRFIQFIRHASQAIFFFFFVILVVGSVCSFSIDWLRLTEPVGGLQTLLSNLININLKILLIILSGISVFVLITVFIGRAWCGWACPVGSIIELGEYIFRKTKIDKCKNVENDQRGKFLNKNTRHAVLGGVLASAIISRSAAWCEICPIGTICRTTSAGGFIVVAETAIIGSVVSSSLYRKRFFCRYICPISSLFTIISKLNFFIKPVVNKKLCKECTLCEKICPEEIPLYKEEELSDCIKCLECYSRCPYGSVNIKATSYVKLSRKNIVVLTLIIVLLATLIPLSYIYTTPLKTQISIYPEKTIIMPGETVTITARLLSHGEPIYNKEIYWWSSEGFFNNNIGHIVAFTAPHSNENKTVEIRAIFYGDEIYLPSNTSIIIQVIYIKKEQTTIVIEPNFFIIRSNENVTLSVLTSPLDLPGELIKWRLTGPGRLSNSSGRIVTYYPPEEIQEEKRVNITVVFEGDIRHLPSTSHAIGLIIPKHLEKKPTILTIYPSNFTIQQGGNITLKASLKTVHGEEVEGLIKWKLEGPGSISSTVGRKVEYRAPVGVDKAYIRIIAYFEGGDRYLPSETMVTGLIIGEKPIVQEIYEARFRKITFEDIISIEDVNTGNSTVMFLKTGKTVVEDVEIINLGLKSRIAVLNYTEIYLTHLIGEIGGTFIDLQDFKKRKGQKTIIVENGLIMFTKLACRETEFYNLSIIGEYVGGEEPYLPIIITGGEVMLSGGYRLDAPKTYGELVNKVMELTSGRIEVRNFSIVKPTDYQLDRTSKKYQYLGKLLLNSSKMIGENLTIYSIYYKVMFRIPRYIGIFGGFVVEATGDIDIRRAVFHFWTGFEIGRICHPIVSAEVHAVHMKFDKCFIKNLTVSSN